MQNHLSVGTKSVIGGASGTLFSRTFIAAAGYSYLAFRMKYLSAEQALTITFIDSNGNTDLTETITLPAAASMTALAIQNIDISTLTEDIYTVNFSFASSIQFSELAAILSDTEVV